ncbi:MAG: glycerophosphoryl diester phosphodiesterase [Humisphaera sp.]|nr:glycerophosphoryl diester phosphodiesterase [Humisphaera sp.]
MKSFMMTLFLAFAAANAADAPGSYQPPDLFAGGEYTITWQQTIASAEQPAPAMTIGETEIAVRPLPRQKEKDAPRAALFIGDKIRSKTLIYPGKPYHFAVVGREGKLQVFINGFPDGEPFEAKLSGRKKVNLAVETTGAAMSEEDILRGVRRHVPERETKVVAHRGVHKHAPENTRISYVQALEAKAPIVEIDTALSKDGVIVLMHDKTVDRTTNGTGNVSDLTADELSRLDAGSWKHEKYAGEPVPRLEDIAELCRGKAVCMLDLKAEGQGKAIAEWLERSKFPRDQVLLAPWTDEEGVALRQHVTIVPMIRLTSQVPTKVVDDAYFAKMRQIGFTGFSVNWQYLTKEFADAARKNGMRVYVWTVNDNADIAGAMLLGVDGVITDDAAVTAKTLAELARK